MIFTARRGIWRRFAGSVTWSDSCRVIEDPACSVDRTPRHLLGTANVIDKLTKWIASSGSGVVARRPALRTSTAVISIGRDELMINPVIDCEQIVAHTARNPDLSTSSGRPTPGWLGSRAVIVLDSGAEGPAFKSQPRRCRVTVLGKLFTPIVPLFTKQQNW